jgi:HSP20 family protein
VRAVGLALVVGVVLVELDRRLTRHDLRGPGEVDADQITAELADGVLTVTVPKSEAAKPRRIEVTSR